MVLYYRPQSVDHFWFADYVIIDFAFPWCRKQVWITACRNQTGVSAINALNQTKNFIEIESSCLFFDKQKLSTLLNFDPNANLQMVVAVQNQNQTKIKEKIIFEKNFFKKGNLLWYELTRMLLVIFVIKISEFLSI